MSDAPKKPEDGESTLSNVAPPAWETVVPAAPVQPQILPPAQPYGGYPGAQSYVPPQGYPPPAPPQQPQGGQAGQGGYRPVFDGGAAPYGAPPANYPPQGYGGQMPYGQPGYPQSNYGQPNVGEMLAMGVLMSRRRRMRRHLILWPLLIAMFFLFIVLHGCVAFMRLL